MKKTILLLMAASLSLAALTPDCSFLPGWKQVGALRTYEADNLFDYMDGNAEGYLIYRFVKMNGVSCSSGADTLVFDISEMADAESAYGMFMANRDPSIPREKIGTEGQVVPRKFTFAKDKYYVEGSIDTDKDHTAVLRAWAQAVDKKLEGSTNLPEQLTWFPTEKLDRESVRLVPESVLGLRILKRGYIAQYEYGKAFVVTEETPEAAAEVMKGLRTRIGETQTVQAADEAFQANERYLGRMYVFRKGRYVAGFANVAEGQDLTAVGSAFAARLK